MKSRVANFSKNKYLNNNGENSLNVKYNYDKEIENRVKEEVSEKFYEMSDKIVRKFLAIALVALEKEFGFKKIRLKRFLDSLDGLANLTMAESVLGKKLTPEDFIKYVQEKYGIKL